MPDSIDAVKLDLVNWFAGIDACGLFDDYARIGSYLSDPSQYRHALEQLNTDMGVFFDQNLDAPVLRDLYPDWRRGLRQYLCQVYKGLAKTRSTVDREKYSMETIAILAFRKILSNALMVHERKNGFQVGSIGEKADALVGFPTGNEFNTFIRKKLVFKDLSAGKEHGENTHRIQWYLISKLGTLAHQVSDVYASLPDWKTPKIGPRSYYLWEFLVDRDGVPSNANDIPFKTAHQNDFRAPSNVNRWLRDGREPHLDLLTAVLTERWDRREGYSSHLYIAKKLKLDWSTLPGELQDMLFASVYLKPKPGANRILRR